MVQTYPDKKNDSKIKWVILIRLIFTTLLLSTTISLQLCYDSSPFARDLLVLYGIIGIIFFLSLCYLLVLPHTNKVNLFINIQVIIDTFIVTAIVFATGGFSSIFSFCYLVVIIYSSLVLLKHRSILVAAFCSIQYGIIIILEYHDIIQPFFIGSERIVFHLDFEHVLYNLLVTMGACFAVAFLCNLLSRQAHESRKKLAIMEEHVKRVDKLALLGSMGAGLAHELKNPLASLIGSIQLLKEDLHYDPGYDKLLQIILREANKLNILANNFLLFAKPPAGKLVNVQLDKELVEIIELFKKGSPYANKISITYKSLPDIWLKIDPEHLRQIFWNLILNAAQSIDGAGFINIDIELLQNEYADIRISDSGCGMSEDTVKSIFNPFFTTKTQGTGLGLSIVHNILEMYGSKITVDSKKGQGTTFTLRFKTIEPPESKINS